MIVPHASVLFLSVLSVSCGSPEKANEFMDTVLSRVREDSPQFAEGISVPNFNVTVSSNRISNRNFKARFFNGKVKGLGDIARHGDCSPTKWTSGNITLECRLSLSKVYVAYAALASGHTLIPRKDNMDVFVNVKTAYLKFEAHSFPNKPAVLKTFIIDGIESILVMRPAPVLNADRRENFEDSVKESSHRALMDAMEQPFASMVMGITKDLFLPPV